MCVAGKHYPELILDLSPESMKHKLVWPDMFSNNYLPDLAHTHAHSYKAAQVFFFFFFTPFGELSRYSLDNALIKVMGLERTP